MRRDPCNLRDRIITDGQVTGDPCNLRGWIIPNLWGGLLGWNNHKERLRACHGELISSLVFLPKRIPCGSWYPRMKKYVQLTHPVNLFTTGPFLSSSKSQYAVTKLILSFILNFDMLHSWKILYYAKNHWVEHNSYCQNPKSTNSSTHYNLVGG